MELKDRIVEVLKLLNDYSSDNEPKIFRSNDDWLHRIPNEILTIDDFTLHCIAITARKHGVVIALDDEGNLWVGEYEHIQRRIYECSPPIKKVYQ